MSGGRSKDSRATALLAGLCLAAATPAAAADLARDSGWPALASDRVAGAAGDSLTVLIYESAAASNSAQTSSRRNTDVAGQVAAGRSAPEAASLALSRHHEGEGQAERSDRMVAQISAVVSRVLPGGDLEISGEQTLQVNGHQTRISVAGRVRPADISAQNTVLSTRLAGAVIHYDGRGFVDRAARPGVVTRVLDKLGLF